MSHVIQEDERQAFDWKSLELEVPDAPPEGWNFEHLLSPIKVGGIELPNRVVMGSMHTGHEEVPGGEDALAAYYAERAAGGAGLMITGGFSPNAEGRLTPGFGSVLAHRESLPSHETVTKAVHDAGGRMLLQILHSGRYGFHPDIVSASPQRAPINPFNPRELQDEEIWTTIEDYARCAELAAEAGYDGVEIMGSEGYFITQFLAPRTNERSDDWGGEAENRQRLAREIVKAVRRRVDRRFVLMFRISLLDLVEGGCTWAEVVRLAQSLESEGVDVFNSGIGWHEARVPTIAAMVPRGGFSWVTQRLRDVVDVPVVAVNRINTPEVAETILAQGRADLVSLARPLLADPHFVNKAAKGLRKRIVPCIACNQACLDHVFEAKLASCLVNPQACREQEIRPEETKDPMKIAVVGAGPAGVFFALTAQRRGHQVTLFERGDKLGGQLNLAKQVPGKEEFHELLRYMNHELHETGVRLRLGWTGGEKEILEGGFQHVVVSTGVRPRIPEIPGVGSPHVHPYDRVLDGSVEVGAQVVVLGGGGVGVDTATALTHGAAQRTPGDTVSDDDQTLGPVEAFLREWGIDPTLNTPGGLFPKAQRRVPAPPHEVTLLKRSRGKIGKGLGKTTVWIHRLALRNRGLEVIDGVSYKEIDDEGVHITTSEGEERCIPADTVVLCAGQVSALELYEGLKEALGEAPSVGLALIGVAHEASGLDAKRAIEQAVRLAAELG